MALLFLRCFFVGAGLFLPPQVFFLFFFIFLMCVYSTPFGSKILVLKRVLLFFRDSKLKWKHSPCWVAFLE